MPLGQPKVEGTLFRGDAESAADHVEAVSLYIYTMLSLLALFACSLQQMMFGILMNFVC